MMPPGLMSGLGERDGARWFSTLVAFVSPIRTSDRQQLSSPNRHNRTQTATRRTTDHVGKFPKTAKRLSSQIGQFSRDGGSVQHHPCTIPSSRVEGQHWATRGLETLWTASPSFVRHIYICSEGQNDRPISQNRQDASLLSPFPVLGECFEWKDCPLQRLQRARQLP